MEDHPEARPLYLAYCGSFDPSDVGIEFTAPPEASDAESLPKLRPGWYGVNVNFIQGCSWFISDGEGGKRTLGADRLVSLQKRTPVDGVSNSVFVYDNTE